jgi:hypothetical protein
LSFIFVKLAFAYFSSTSWYIASFNNFPSLLLSNYPKSSLKIFISSYFTLKLKEEFGLSAATGRTVRLLLADCPPGQRGPSAWLVGAKVQHWMFWKH